MFENFKLTLQSIIAILGVVLLCALLGVAYYYHVKATSLALDNLKLTTANASLVEVNKVNTATVARLKQDASAAQAVIISNDSKKNQIQDQLSRNKKGLNYAKKTNKDVLHWADQPIPVSVVRLLDSSASNSN